MKHNYVFLFESLFKILKAATICFNRQLSSGTDGRIKTSEMSSLPQKNDCPSLLKRSFVLLLRHPLPVRNERMNSMAIYQVTIYHVATKPLISLIWLAFKGNVTASVLSRVIVHTI